MSRKSILSISLIVTVLLWAAQVWAAPLPVDPRVKGSVAGGWSYTDGTGETSSLSYDVQSLTGSFDAATTTFTFNYLMGGTAPATPVFGSGANLLVQLDWDRDFATVEAEANVLELFDGAWNDFSSNLLNANPFSFSGNTVTATMTVSITPQQAQTILHDGFFFAFTSGEASGSEDTVDPYSGTLPAGLDQNWLYVVPEPGSLLLFGSGLGLLLPVLRRKAQK